MNKEMILVFEKETGIKQPNRLDGVAYDNWEDLYVDYLERQIEKMRANLQSDPEQKYKELVGN